MAQRELMALWMLPLAYVIAYRLLAQLVWRTMPVAGYLEISTMQLVSPAVTVLCAIASAVACVLGHRRAVGPLPSVRAWLMALIALPLLLAAHVYSLGVDGFLRFLGNAPVMAGLAYSAVLLALPLVATIFVRKPVVAVGSGSVPRELPARTDSAAAGGTAALRILVALASIAAFLGWGVIVLFMIGLKGFGTGSSDPWTTAMLCVPLAIFGVCFVATLGILRRTALAVVRGAVMVIAVPLVIFLATHDMPGFTIALCVAFVAMFWLMCRRLEERG